jgi:protein O-GlcNAc transferase
MLGPDAAIDDGFFDAARAEIQGGRLDAAKALLKKAVARDPASPAPLYLLGLLNCGQGRLTEGAADLRRVLAFEPGHREARRNLGLALCHLGQAAFAQGDYAQAETHFRDAGCLAPDSAPAAAGLGHTLLQQGRIEAAIAQYGAALQREPQNAALHFARAAAAFVAGCLGDAISGCDEALAHDPNFIAAAINRAIYRRHACDWQDFAADQALLREAVARGAGMVPPFAFLNLTASAAEQLACARRATQSPALRGLATLPAPVIATGAKIRLGYLSCDFRAHATAYLTAELFERHDRERFEVIGYSLGRNDGSAIGRRVAAAFDEFVDLSEVPVKEAAQRIRADKIEILVDLNAYAQNGRPQIVARRPAPVQVNYLGYPGTMGADFIDYVLVDPVVVPKDQQEFFTERLVHLPETYQVNDSRRVIAAVTPSRTACGLPERGFVFCCLNSASKITPTIFAIWMRLLAATPGSVLWLLEGNALAPARLRHEAGRLGVAPERLVFAPLLPLDQHLARHHRADLFLDTLPYGAHTTMSDALWAGLPAVTCLGETFPGRVGASLLRAVGLPELVTDTLADYENLALRLASYPDELAALRLRLAHNRATAPLFDTARFTHHLEAAYRRMSHIWRRGGQPEAFAIAPDATY